MRALLGFILVLLVSPFRSRSRLEAENAALRQQLIVLRRQVGKRVRLTNGDRLFFVQLYRWWVPSQCGSGAADWTMLVACWTAGSLDFHPAMRQRRRDHAERPSTTPHATYGSALPKA
jgi:hypothetical protein